MKFRNLFAKAALTFGLVAASLLSSQAALVTTFSDINYWIGSGSNESAMVIQWNDGNSPQSVVWGFRWDDAGTTTVQDMLFAIAGNISVTPGAPQPALGSDQRVGLSLGYSESFGYFLDGASYNQMGLGGDFANTVRNQAGYGMNGESWTLYDLGTNVTWPTSSVMPADFGMSSLTLADNGWYGWSYTAAFLPPLYDPVAFTFDQPTAAVPEPGTLGLLLAGGITLVCLRRNRREKCRI